MRTNQEARDQFADALVFVRSQLRVPEGWPDPKRRGLPCNSWPEFVAAAQEIEPRLKDLDYHAFEKAQQAAYKTTPKLEVLAVIHQLGCFRLKNGEPATMDRLTEILQGLRLGSGELAEPCNGQPRA